MSKSNNTELATSTYLLDRFNKDVQAVYTQMQILEIAFSNLKGSWFAISSSHNVFKLTQEETEGEG